MQPQEITITSGKAEAYVSAEWILGEVYDVTLTGNVDLEDGALVIGLFTSAGVTVVGSPIFAYANESWTGELSCRTTELQALFTSTKDVNVWLLAYNSTTENVYCRMQVAVKWAPVTDISESPDEIAILSRAEVQQLIDDAGQAIPQTATQAEMEAGTEAETRTVSPVLVAQAIAALAEGTTTFTGLTDTPASYAGQSGKVATVNESETALEFADAGSGTGYIPNMSLNGATYDSTRGTQYDLMHDEDNPLRLAKIVNTATSVKLSLYNYLSTAGTIRLKVTASPLSGAADVAAMLDVALTALEEAVVEIPIAVVLRSDLTVERDWSAEVGGLSNYVKLELVEVL